MRNVITHSPEETRAFAAAMAREARPGQIICLDGDLGAGKTVFAQGFAEGLGFSGYVNSPTFTILQVYEGGRLPLYHFDVYRIGDPEEMDEIGCEEYFYGEGVCLIEWSVLIADMIPETAVHVTIEKSREAFDDRTITVS